MSPAAIAKIASISSRFDSGVGFSNGCDELALKKPPPLVPSSLITSCDATGPCAITCSAPSTVLTWVYALKFCGTPCHTSTSAPMTLIGKSTHRIARVISTQKFPMVLRAAPHEAANHGDRDRDSRSGRDEIVEGEPGHLGEIAHRRFTAVSLPVRIGGEARSGIECEIGRDRAELLRIQRQIILQALNCIEHQHPHHAEKQHRDGIFNPRFLGLGMNSANPVNSALDRLQHGIEHRRLTGEDPRHIEAERDADRRHQRAENSDLDNCVCQHDRALLELLGTQHRVHQVSRQTDSHNRAHHQFPGTHRRMHPQT